MSDDFKRYESMFMMMHNNPTEKVNAEYVEDIKIYLKSPVASCDKKQSLKLLKQFARKDFPAFWNESVNIGHSNLKNIYIKSAVWYNEIKRGVIYVR